MSYHVLARKWRPKTFHEIIGQEHILRMLSNALDNQRLHHAYLFTGTRGVGKTTLARIFAKCLNCETAITSKPCGTCSTCQAIDQGRFIDLLEIDAASRTKVEDTREILDNVQYAPTAGRFKIYLIDEVHMLSGHSFNALLKTLEEPPPHIKFLLATTDPKRLPITILSRCLQFNLKRVSIEHIAQQLQTICTAEQIQFEAPALQLLARAADGSLRDALSLLDQSIAFCGKTITTQDIRAMLGTVPQDTIFALLQALAEKNGKKLLDEVSRLSEITVQFDQLLEELITTLHQIALKQIISDLPNTSDEINELAQKFSPEDVQLYYQIALMGRRDLPYTPNPTLGFEMIMLRMLAFKPVTQPETDTTQAKTILAPTAKTTTQVSPASQPTETQDWQQILSQLKLTGLAQQLASHCTLQKLSENYAEFALNISHQSLLNPKQIERIEQALSQYFSRPIKTKINIATTELNTPAKQQQAVQQARKDSATSTITNDDNVKKMIEMFDATLSSDSIEALDDN